MTALATSPQQVREAARTLLGAASGLEETAARLGRARTVSADGWHGVAALGQQAATERARSVVQARSAPVREVAHALSHFADQAAEAQRVTRAAQQRRQEASTQRQHQVALLASVTDPQQVAAIRDRIRALDRLIQGAEDELSWVEKGLEQARQLVDHVLRESWLGIDVDDLADLVNLGRDLVPIWRGSSLTVVGGRVLLTTAQLAREVSPVVRVVLEAKLDRLLAVIRKPPMIFVVSRLAFRIIIPMVVIPEAWGDVRDGGGYDGIRGVALRTTALLAIPGSVAMIIPHGVVAGVGSITVGAYYLTKGGFALWDHRQVLVAVAKGVYERRKRAIKTAWRVLQPSPAFPLGPLGPMAPLLPRAGDLLAEMPRLEDLARYIPAIGGAISMPQVPIEVGPRLPAISLPSLGVIGAGIVLPKLGDLF